MARKIGTSKAWHVTTKLAMVLIAEVRKPREGALHSFNAGDGISMAKVIFYLVLRSLDVMSEIAAVDYRDSPVVSTKLVKFLSLNTSVEAVDKLETVTGELSESFKYITKTVTAQVKSLHSVGNKHDELKKTVEAMRRMLEKLGK